jgi:ketosteroid isomerase-like protein
VTGEEAIRALEEQRYAAMLAGDVAALERLLDDALSYTHSNGVVDTKASYITGVRDRVWEYKSISRENERVVLRGDAALVYCRLHIELLVRGAPRKVDASVLGVWVRSGAEWRLLAIQSTPAAS